MDFLVTRAPFRISFAGGGTDLPSFYQRGYGTVLSTTIDKYVYVIINRVRPILRSGVDDPGRFRIRLSYASTENAQHPDELSHPIVREALKFLDLDTPMDIATMADVPAGNGLGSSGAFTVALLHALHLIKGDKVDPEQLASEAAHIEIEILGRPVGKQDHYAAAYGGLNLIQFHASEQVDVRPVSCAALAQQQLFPWLMLMYTGVSRDAARVLAEQRDRVDIVEQDLIAMRDHAAQLDNMFSNGLSLPEFGEVLHETWQRKRALTNSISSQQIDVWYQSARNAGALGGKLCGAGGGGFLMLVVEPERQEAVRRVLDQMPELSISYEPLGSKALLPGTDFANLMHGSRT